MTHMLHQGVVEGAPEALCQGTSKGSLDFNAVSAAVGRVCQAAGFEGVHPFNGTMHVLPRVLPS